LILTNRGWEILGTCLKITAEYVPCFRPQFVASHGISWYRLEKSSSNFQKEPGKGSDVNIPSGLAAARSVDVEIP
jgi:hypothetical protein